MEHAKKDLVKIVILIVIAVISFAFLSRAVSSPKLHAHEIESLERKRVNITRLTAAATISSVGVTLLPGDTATPIAENLADLNDYFLIALCAVYLEKYLITMTGFASFGVLFPLALLFMAVWIRKKDPRLTYYAKKLAAFGIAIMLVIPASVAVSDAIEDTYQFSIEDTIIQAENLGSEIEAETEALDENGNFFTSIIDSAGSVVNSVVDKGKGWIEKGEKVLNELLEALAVLLVTSCLIPIAVLFLFLWLIQIFTNIDVPTPYPRKMHWTKKFLGMERRELLAADEDEER